MDNLEKLKASILEAVDKVNQNGYSIVSGWFGSKESKCCCPLTALALAQNDSVWDESGRTDLFKIQKAWSEAAQDQYGLNDFFEGFDGCHHDSPSSYFNLGQEIRKELEKKANIVDCSWNNSSNKKE